MSNYKEVKVSEIKEAFERNPEEGALMMMAGLNLKEADEIANGLKTHKIENHKDGWYLTFDTSNGVVGLWSCWLGDNLVLCFPKDVTIKSEDIADILELQLNKDNQRCGQYCSERIEDKGRLWVDYTDHDCYARYFNVIKDKELKETYYGHDQSNIISISKFGFSGDKKDAPTVDKEIIMQYRDNFIKLLMFIANKIGEIKSIGIQYQLPVFIPEELEVEGYSEIEWIKGGPDYRNGWGSELVYATQGKEQLMLKSANSLVPWVCYRQFKVNNNKFSLSDILSLLTV